jgi:DNA-binding MarR family transcriptional regulator
MPAAAPPRVAPSHGAGVVDALRRIVRALRVSASEVERSTGISSAQLFVLRVVAASPGGSLGDVRSATLTDLSSVSAVVSRLVERGLVRRGTSPGDARRAALDVTAAGRALLRRAPSPAQERLVSALRRLPRAEVARLSASLGRLAAALGAADGPGAMFFEDAGPKASSPRRGRA